MNEKVFRVFASVDQNDKDLKKVKNGIAEKYLMYLKNVSLLMMTWKGKISQPSWTTGGI